MQNTGLNPKIIFFLSSQVFYIALFQAILNWQIFKNPKIGAIFFWPTK